MSSDDFNYPSLEGKAEMNDLKNSRVQDKEFLEMSDSGACLSLHQPWASLLVAGIKM